MQLAAAEMYNVLRNSEYLNHAVHYGRLEPVTPWMGADSALIINGIRLLTLEIITWHCKTIIRQQKQNLFEICEVACSE